MHNKLLQRTLVVQGFIVKQILLLFLFFSSTLTFAEEMSHKGVSYSLEVKNESLACKSIVVQLTTKSLPFSIRESQIPYELTMGHYGNPHLVSQSIRIGEKSLESIDSLIPTYERIDGERKYLAKLGACTGDNSFTLSFWGGGNCKNVCEAWALVDVTENSDVKKIRGLTYQEFKSYN